ncbi:methylenetetrahydrofolate reductase [NAD(P)H] [Algoriphagus sp. NF]|jgi:5,10-methylenetetrahydrofolate reductase, prokaryotic form|uniref:Methylenetetrahydrofolate reductase n=1 Tax=Algoriphagus marincola TaxID=264027 RepID=A0ABS7N1C8_9BACT|nr:MULTISPECIES: methylenetetrahydrofolate reductase [NAD(P)H] [Algoriphagus]MBY5950130.1 methylenetetrahydrofolate reductase [NAD(P)H] [Algoriphagus marincola]MDE0561398.1 methylenetetrahydrofolate reductase [NAD(P)H] [Algoriphagus sp. NF]
MKITDHLKNAKSTLFSFEILPPLKGQSLKELLEGIEPLMEFKPPFVDVTYHREEYIYKKHPNGLLEKVSTKKRPGTVGICAAIMNRFQVDAVPHLLCGGFSKEETENALIDLNFIGVENVLALRGDAPKTEGKFIPEKNGHHFASELVDQIIRMNQGKYLHEETETSFHTNFCVGVAGYPEKHFEAPSMKFDLKYLKEKVDRGAEYIVTQMFFDNEKFFEFERNVRAAGIDVPIIPGLKPITTLSQITMLPRTFFLDLPDALTDELLKCKTNAEVKEIGIEWAIQQSKELVKAGVPSLHFYTMSKAEATYKIAKEVF